ncbi:MAG TPA: hypothetical protein VHS52_03640 [Acidimicrobiales bacterium]|nr:hypothetical protein [Acidimicrobiales bacterium]
MPIALTATTATTSQPRPPAVLVLVPDLRWAGAPGLLDGWARASLSVRTDRQRGDAADGYLTVGKGARAAAPIPALGVGPVEPTGDGGLRLADWGRLQAQDTTTNYAGALGALGQAMTAAGRHWTLVTSGPSTWAAAAAVADRHGIVAHGDDGGASGVSRALSGGADAVVAAVPAAEVPAVAGAASSTCVVLASVSSPDSDRHLGVLATSPACGLGHAGLSSPSTHQAHLATIDDVAPTFLSVVGVPRPTDMAGSVVRPSGPVSVSNLIERDRRSFTADGMRPPLVWLFVVLSAVGAAIAVLWRRARPAVAWVLLAIPPASFLVMVVPWWRWGGGAVVVVGAAIVGILAAGAAVVGRRHVRLGVAALGALTAAVVGIDAIFGGRLEIDAPFGNSPVTAGRFYGVGNIGSGFLMAGLIVAVGLALDHWGRRALAPGVAFLGAGVVVGGAPWFGADVGGVLAAVPAYGTLVVARRRPSLRTVGVVIAATVVILGLFVAADLARPASARSHLGRVIADGSLKDEITRKGSRALETVATPLSLVVVIGIAAVAAVRPRLAGRPGLVAMTSGLVVAAVLGSVVNDSGLIVGAAVTAVAWPALVAVAGTDGGTQP